jgi:hypothetical protein
MKDKSVRIEQIRLACQRLKEDAVGWGRVQKSIKSSKPVTNDRFNNKKS